MNPEQTRVAILGGISSEYLKPYIKEYADDASAPVTFGGTNISNLVVERLKRGWPTDVITFSPELGKSERIQRWGSGAVAAERYYVDYLQKYQDLEKICADGALLKLCNKRLQEQSFVKSLARKKAASLELFYVALLRGAGVSFSVIQLLKYTFPNLTVQKRKLASVVRRLLRLQRG